MLFHKLHRNRQHFIFLVVFVLNLFGNHFGFGQQLGLPFIKYISSSDYNAGMQNSAIVQDGRGFIYVANNFGLLEFDGSKWELYPVRDGSKVRDVAVSADGKIFIAAQGDYGYFVPDRIGRLKYVSLADSLPESYRNFDEVWKVFIGKTNVYFCSLKNIFIYNNNTLKEVVAIEPTTNFYFLTNRLYLQQEDAGFYSIKNRKVENLISKERLKNKDVAALLPFKDNKFLVVTANSGIYDNFGARHNIPINWEQTLSNSTINSALRLRNGNLAFGTQNNGLFIYTEGGELVVHLNRRSGLNNRVILSLLEDKQGNLWIGHNNGMTIIELSLPFSYINEELGLQGSGYDAFSLGDDLFLATNNGLYHRELSAANKQFELIPNTSGQAYYVNEVKGKILLGHHKGTYEIENNEAKVLAKGVGTWTYLKTDNLSNTMIAGSYRGLQLFRFTESSWKFVTNIKGFNESSRVMEFDDFGNIWMTHGYKGVYKLKLNNVQDSVVDIQFYGPNEGLPSKALINVFKIGNDLIYTTPKGPYVFDYNENRFKPEPNLSKYEVLKRPLNFLADDSNQNIYFLGRHEMGILIKKTDGTFKENVNIFNNVHTLLNDDLENIAIVNSSNVLFGAKEGFVVYNPIVNSESDNNYHTYIRDITITSEQDSVLFAGNFSEGNRIVFDQPKGLIPILPFKKNSIRFSYCADFMNGFDQTKYQYMLEGFEEEWSHWYRLPEKEYTNLSEGEYVFRVRAKNIYNDESQETLYKFTILPPWFRSKVAYAGYSVFISVILLLGFVFVNKKLKESRRRYELKKQLEVDEIDDQLKSLKQESTEKIEKLKSDKLQTEIEFKNAELASSTMNLINKNKFITGIKGNLTNICKKSKSAEVIRELKKITNDIEKNISQDDDWNQFAFHFNQVHGDFTTRLTTEFTNLSGQDIRLCSYLRLSLSSKEIAQLLNISTRGVEISRYRLRKKLDLSRSNNLSEFILNF